MQAAVLTAAALVRVFTQLTVMAQEVDSPAHPESGKVDNRLAEDRFTVAHTQSQRHVAKPPAGLEGASETQKGCLPPAHLIGAADAPTLLLKQDLM